MGYATLNDWLDETENFGLRRERIPDGALPWIEMAWTLGAESAERSAYERAATVVEEVPVPNIPAEYALLVCQREVAIAIAIRALSPPQDRKENG